MKSTCTKNCDRCDGTGQVYAHKDKPLFCSVRKGQYLHGQHQTSDSNFLKDTKNLITRLEIQIAMQDPSLWGAMTCPDCKGQAKWVYTLEQLAYNEQGVIVEPT